MRWDVSYTKESTKEACWYSRDNELNYDGSFIEAASSEEAELLVRSYIAELMRCNCLEVEENVEGLTVFEHSDHEFIENYTNFNAVPV